MNIDASIDLQALCLSSIPAKKENRALAKCRCGQEDMIAETG